MRQRIILAIALVILIGVALIAHGQDQPTQQAPVQQYNAACLDNAASGCELVR